MYYAIKKLYYFGLILALSAIFAGVSLAQDDKDKVVPPSTPAQTAQTTPKLTTGERYRIGFQDQIEIEVFRHPELSQKTDVAQDGTIRLPRVAESVVAVCKTERELAEEITSRYKKYLNQPFVTVRVGDQKSQSFAVIGAAVKPGMFFLNRRVRLLELLAFAGGPSDKAGAKLYVARTGSSSVCQQDTQAVATAAERENPDMVLMTYQIKDVQEGKQNLWMQPGDIISIPEPDVVYIVGNVNHPRSFPLKEPTTLSQAIAAAEGLKQFAKDKVRVLRKVPGSSQPQELVFSLSAIIKREKPDPLLEANDIVSVSEDSIKSTTSSIVKALTGGLSSLPYFIFP
jgi:polysaccharide export outer membrane protein